MTAEWKTIDVPEDVKEAAFAAGLAWLGENAGADEVTELEVLGVAAIAILAERERCAKVAEAHNLDPEYAEVIARAIRNPPSSNQEGKEK